jgi:hypothetical protein
MRVNRNIILQKENMKYQTKTLIEIKEACVIQEALILKLLSLVSEDSIDTASINNDYGVLKSRLMYALKHYKKPTVKRDATPDEIAYYFSMAKDIYPELKVSIRGKIDIFFIETLEVALKLTREYLSKIERAEV